MGQGDKGATEAFLRRECPVRFSVQARHGPRGRIGLHRAPTGSGTEFDRPPQHVTLQRTGKPPTVARVTPHSLPSNAAE